VAALRASPAAFTGCLTASRFAILPNALGAMVDMARLGKINPITGSVRFLKAK
jgi:hypothetical protein